jgi:hypothetical protein
MSPAKNLEGGGGEKGSKKLMKFYSKFVNISRVGQKMSFWAKVSPYWGTKQTLQKKTVGFLPWEIRKKTWDLSVLFFAPAPNIFHNFVSFHPILKFLTILESGHQTNNIGGEFKTIRPN